MDLLDIKYGSDDGEPEPLRDTSGKPKPENVRVRLESGLEIRCDLRYDGMEGQHRRYLVLAELDWNKSTPVAMIVGVYPRDVMLGMRLSDDTPEYLINYRANLLANNTIAEKIIEC